MLVLAGWLRFYGINTYSLWGDEVITWWFTNLSWSEMINQLLADGVHPPFFFIIEKAVTSIAGTTEIGLRIFSLLLGLGSIFFMYKVGRMVGGLVGGLAAIWFWSFHPMAIWYSGDARHYSLVVFLAAGLIYSYMKIEQGELKKGYLGALLTLTLGQFSHFYFFVLGGSYVLFVLSGLKQKPKTFRNWMIVWLGSCIPLAIWLIYYFSQTGPVLEIGWIQPVSFMGQMFTIWNLFSGYGAIFLIPTTLFGLINLILAGVGLYNNRGKIFFQKILWAGILFPIVGIWIVSQRRIIYMDRYFTILIPFVVILISSGASVVYTWIHNRINLSKRNWMYIILMTFFIMIGIWTGLQVHVKDNYQRTDWKGLVGFLENSVSNGEKPLLWLAHPDPTRNFLYYRFQDYIEIDSDIPPVCLTTCWYVMQQPYIATHAFSQAVSLPEKPWLPDLPTGCTSQDRWGSTSGVHLWQVICEETDL